MWFKFIKKICIPIQLTLKKICFILFLPQLVALHLILSNEHLINPTSTTTSKDRPNRRTTKLIIHYPDRNNNPNKLIPHEEETRCKRQNKCGKLNLHFWLPLLHSMHKQPILWGVPAAIGLDQSMCIFFFTKLGVLFWVHQLFHFTAITYLDFNYPSILIWAWVDLVQKNGSNITTGKT